MAIYNAMGAMPGDFQPPAPKTYQVPPKTATTYKPTSFVMRAPTPAPKTMVSTTGPLKPTVVTQTTIKNFLENPAQTQAEKVAQLAAALSTTDPVPGDAPGSEATTPFITTTKSLTTGGSAPDTHKYAFAALITGALLVGGFIVYKKVH